MKPNGEAIFRAPDRPGWGLAGTGLARKVHMRFQFARTIIAVAAFSRSRGWARCCSLVANSPVRAQDQQPQQPGDILTTLEQQGNNTTFLRAIQAAGLGETLKGEGPYTVFAPTDEAFGKLPEGKLDELMANPEALKEMISFHVVAKAHRTA